MTSAVLNLMKDRNELRIDVSGAWVREVSLMLATSRLFSSEHLDSLPYKHESEISGNRNKMQLGEPLR